MKKKAVRLIGVILVSAFLLTGCGSTSNYKMSDSEESYSSQAAAEYSYEDNGVSTLSTDGAVYETAMAGDNTADRITEEAADSIENASDEITDEEASERKLIRTLNVDTETSDFDTFLDGIEKKTAELGGYAEYSSMYGSAEEHSRYASYTLRIPKEKADSFVEEIDGDSNIVSRSESVEDITLTYVDIESRKKALSTEYDRLETLLENAESVEDIISIEDRMSEVRYELESIESQLRTYDNKIDYTTINLTVEEVIEYTEAENPDPTYFERLTQTLKNTFKGLWEFLQSFSIFLIAAIPVIVILAIPVVLIILLVRRIVRWIGRRHGSRKKTGRNAGSKTSTDMVQSSGKPSVTIDQMSVSEQKNAAGHTPAENENEELK